jgi:ribonuclease HI
LIMCIDPQYSPRR